MVQETFDGGDEDNDPGPEILKDCMTGNEKSRRGFVLSECMLPEFYTYCKLHV